MVEIGIYIILKCFVGFCLYFSALIVLAVVRMFDTTLAFECYWCIEIRLVYIVFE